MILDREHVRTPAWTTAPGTPSEPCTGGSQRHSAVSLTAVERAWITRRSAVLPQRELGTADLPRAGRYVHPDGIPTCGPTDRKGDDRRAGAVRNTAKGVCRGLVMNLQRDTRSPSGVHGDRLVAAVTERGIAGRCGAVSFSLWYWGRCGWRWRCWRRCGMSCWCGVWRRHWRHQGRRLGSSSRGG